MRTIRYEKLPGIGPGVLPVQGPLLQFMLDIPYFFAFRLIPTLEVLNDFLSRGGEDSGMSGGCRWEPFQITKEECNILPGRTCPTI